MKTRMLEGYKVLDFTQALAGPTATRYLAQMGAEVIKVELAPDGDLARAVPFMRDGRSAYYVQQNRCKKSLCLDAKKLAGLAILKGLIPKVDVLIQNFAPGVIERIGLDYENRARAEPQDRDVFNLRTRTHRAPREPARI